MKKLLKRFNKWFDLNISWYFINGRKTEQWKRYLIKKYTLKDE